MPDPTPQEDKDMGDPGGVTTVSSSASRGRPARKTDAQHFADWEVHVFGFGYGTGETHTLGALKEFFDLLEPGEWEPDREPSRSYDYAKLEEALTPRVAWLLINALCHADIIEYGTSPRYGWMTAKGERLRDFIAGKSVDDLYAMTNRDEDDFPCYPDACNCGPMGHQEGVICPNPFWGDFPLSGVASATGVDGADALSDPLPASPKALKTGGE